jgi:hypothetical protein
VSLSKAGASFVSLDEQIDTAAPEGKSIVRVLTTLNDMNMELARVRIRKLRNRKARGEYLGQVPYGLKLAKDKAHLVRNDKEINVVGTIIRLRREGHSYRSIAKTLAALQIAPRYGNFWHPKVIMDIYSRHEDERAKSEVDRPKVRRSPKPKVHELTINVKTAALRMLRQHLLLKLENQEQVGDFLSEATMFKNGAAHLVRQPR